MVIGDSMPASVTTFVRASAQMQRGAIRETWRFWKVPAQESAANNRILAGTVAKAVEKVGAACGNRTPIQCAE